MVDHTQAFIQTTFIHIKLHKLGIDISQFKFKYTEVDGKLMTIF